VSNARVFGKVYFPRLSVPIAILLAQLISFAIQLSLFLGFLVFFAMRGVEIRLTAWVAALPLLLALMTVLGLGFGIIVSSLTARYRDLTQLVTFGVSLLMYATPVIYPLSAVPERYRLPLMANPMTPIVETFRLAFLGEGTTSPAHLLYAAVFAGIALAGGVLLFHRVERTFMDTV
jgi:lipopolysaccharide transport system permease protein